MSEWVKVGDSLPKLLPVQDYLKVNVRCKSGAYTTAFYCKNWGWRDHFFNQIYDVLEWSYTKNDT